MVNAVRDEDLSGTGHGQIILPSSDLASYFLLGQFMTEQLAQFSSSSFSMPKGIVSPQQQTQLSAVLVLSS